MRNFLGESRIGGLQNMEVLLQQEGMEQAGMEPQAPSS